MGTFPHSQFSGGLPVGSILMSLIAGGTLPILEYLKIKIKAIKDMRVPAHVVYNWGVA